MSSQRRGDRRGGGLPPTIDVRGKRYKLTVFIVRRNNEDGTVSLLEHLRDDDVANVSGGETEFVTAYLPLAVVTPQLRVSAKPQGEISFPGALPPAQDL